MYVVTLISKDIDHTIVDELHHAWGGGEVSWLCPDGAAEFPVATIPNDIDSARKQLGSFSLDIAIQPSANRRKKLLIADMDSTMIQQECIDELAIVAGVGERVADITARAMNGEIGFNDALRERVGLLKGLDSGVIDTVFNDHIAFTPGGLTLVQTMKANGAYAALVSGGFTSFTEKVAAALGFDEHRANTLEVENGTLTGTVGEPILGREAKVEALQDICARLGITEADALAVGDGANDLGMLGRAGMGVALHAKPTVAAQADIRIDYGDLTALLFLQGYSREEFV